MRELAAGDRLDDFLLLELIARSGMATIFKARNERSGELVAIKLPYLQYESDVAFYSRFEREEQIGLKLDHPNVVRVFKVENKSRPYLVIEYVEGRPLRSLMTRGVPVPLDQALAIAKQLCCAVSYLHRLGVVHRDLKPENIMVTADGRIKIMDFGIAFDSASRRVTWSGLSTTMGTPDYMAPEQISGRRGDPRSDIYAIGTILYEMLTGHLPYCAESVVQLMKLKVSSDPIPPRHWRPELDLALEEIVLRAIERRPADRYQRAEEMLADLESPEKVKITGRAARLRPARLMTSRTRRLLLQLIVVLTLVAAGVLVVWLASKFPAPQPGAPVLRERMR